VGAFKFFFFGSKSIQILCFILNIPWSPRHILTHSISIKTVAGATIDTFFSSYWLVNKGSGFLLADCVPFGVFFLCSHHGSAALSALKLYL
jgi:hypothetical protein